MAWASCTPDLDDRLKTLYCHCHVHKAFEKLKWREIFASLPAHSRVCTVQEFFTTPSLWPKCNAADIVAGPSRELPDLGPDSISARWPRRWYCLPDELNEHAAELIRFRKIMPSSVFAHVTGGDTCVISIPCVPRWLDHTPGRSPVPEFDKEKCESFLVHIAVLVWHACGQVL